MTSRTKNAKSCTGTASAPQRKSTRKPAQPRRSGSSKSATPVERKTETPRSAVASWLVAFTSGTRKRLSSPGFRKWAERMSIGAVGGAAATVVFVGLLYQLLTITGPNVSGPVFLGVLMAHFGYLTVRWWEAR
jgi:hypothetical protein